MSEILAKAVAALSEKMGDGFDGSVKFLIDGEGAIMVDSDGVREGDEDADCTMSADAETFEAIMGGGYEPHCSLYVRKAKG